MAEDLVYDNSIEAIFKGGIGRRMTPRCLQRLKQEGIDPTGPLRPTYPRVQVFRCLDIVREELFPGVEREQALRTIGHEFLDGFERTLVGKAMVGLMRLLGPRRTLGRAAQNMQSSNNYQRTEVRDVGPNEVELTLSQVSGCGSYFAGVLQAAVEIAGGKDTSVELLPGGEPGCTYRIRWK